MQLKKRKKKKKKKKRRKEEKKIERKKGNEHQITNSTSLRRHQFKRSKKLQR